MLLQTSYFNSSGARFLTSLGWESSKYNEDTERVQFEELGLDPSNLWINCVDVCTSDPHYIVKTSVNQVRFDQTE